MPVIAFEPIAMERIWGGRKLETKYGRALPTDDRCYGESWEIVDRDDAQSVVRNGIHEGKTLQSLWQNHRSEIFGSCFGELGRFPLLVKILDAHDDLSIQVHPPAHLAESLGGEPKTEMWYIAAAEEGSKLYVGLKNGQSCESFAKAIEQGAVEQIVHQLPVSTGDSIFIPSGRLHAIGAGLLIFEIQQNSDTTYRVFDWNRLDKEGNARALHIAESLASIDYDDVEPAMDLAHGNVIAACDFFVVEKLQLGPDAQLGNAKTDRFSLIHVVEGSVVDELGVVWSHGTSLLIPRGLSIVTALENTLLLRTHIP